MSAETEENGAGDAPSAPVIALLKEPAGDESKDAFNLLGLPLELLFNVLDHLDIRDHRNIRNTSRAMRRNSDAYLMHKFNHKLLLSNAREPPDAEGIAMNVMRMATEVYLCAGYETIFCDCLLQLPFKGASFDSFQPERHELGEFLLRFYNRVDAQLNGSQISYLYFVVTVIRLLQQFDKCETAQSPLECHQMGLSIMLSGAFVGRVWTSAATEYSGRVKQRNALLVMLAEVLVFNKKRESFTCLWEYLKECFIYGFEKTDTSLPVTFVQFDVEGSSEICTYLNYCFFRSHERFRLPKRWPRGELKLNLAFSANSKRWCSSRAYRMDWSAIID